MDLAPRVAALESQVVDWVASIAAQANATRVAAEAARTEVRDEVALQLAAISSDVHGTVDRLTEQIAEDRRALRLALDSRLAEMESRHDWRLTEIEARLETFARPLDLAPGATTLPPPSAVVEHVVDERIAAVTGPLLARFDAWGSEIDRIDAELRRVDANGAALHRYVVDLHGVLDRADVLGSGARAEEAIALVRREADERLTAVTSAVAQVESRVEQLGEVARSVDVRELDSMREKLQTAIGESVLMRIEVDRLTAGLDERFDALKLRLAEIEEMLDSESDASTAVQLERLEELERAVMMLTPSRPVTEAAVARASAIVAVPTRSTFAPPPPPADGAPAARLPFPAALAS